MIDTLSTLTRKALANPEAEIIPDASFLHTTRNRELTVPSSSALSDAGQCNGERVTVFDMFHGNTLRLGFVLCRFISA